MNEKSLLKTVGSILTCTSIGAGVYSATNLMLSETKEKPVLSRMKYGEKAAKGMKVSLAAMAGSLLFHAVDYMSKTGSIEESDENTSSTDKNENDEPEKPTEEPDPISDAITPGEPQKDEKLEKVMSDLKDSIENDID